MRRGSLLIVLIALLLVCSLSVSGLFAKWYYYGPTEAGTGNVVSNMSAFKYGLLYITNVSVVQGAYNSAQAAKSADLNLSANMALQPTANGQAVVEVTFYNSTVNSFYYNKTEVVSWSNEAIGYTVSGIKSEDEIPGKSYKTIRVTFAFDGNKYSANTLSSELHFNFVVDKDSIGDIVALTAVDRFRAILNNEAFANSYQTLENAMNDRSGLNKASAVTYIGNVVGANTQDSNTIKTLFTEEFLSMDLDGDGKAEPITMMIKRENLDNNTATGDAYTYTNWGRTYTVNGAEMTIYITAENLSNVSSGKSVVVYAASFTKLAGAEEWTELVPLTTGTASANNYGGYGSANSFNTDTWKSSSGKSIEELVG